MSKANDFVIRDGILERYTGLSGEVVIPDGVTELGYYAFYKCANLTSVTIPAGVTSIGYGAFFECSSLTHVTILDGVTPSELRHFSIV